MINMFLLHLERCYDTHVDYILAFFMEILLAILVYHMQSKIWGQWGRRE